MILVTGSTGFIGRALMKQLQEAGIEAKEFNGRINNPISISEQLQDIDIVIHLSGAETRGRNRLLNHIDIEGTQRLLEECRRANVQHIIYASRIGADPIAMHPLLKAKGEAERLIQKSGIPYTILRSVSLYGWGDRYFEMIVGCAIWSWPVVWLPGGGHMPVQPLWVEDFARCLIEAIRQDMKNKLFNVAGEERLPYRQLVQMLLHMSGHRRIPFPIPLVLVKPLSNIFFRWWYWPAISHYFVDRFFTPEITDTDSIRRHFGFRPARVQATIAYLNRSGLRWRILRR